MIKYIFSDLDGTLLYHTLPNGEHNRDFLASNKISDENITSITNLKVTPLFFSIATGRPDGDILKIENQLKIKGFRISQNGAFVYDDSDNLIVNNAFKQNEILEIITKLERNGYYFYYICPNKLYFSSNFPENEKQLIIESKGFLVEIDSIKNAYQVALENEMPGHLSVQVNQVEFQVKMENELKQLIGTEKFNVCISSPKSIDITTKKASKGQAIAKICEKFKIDLDEVAVIGDSWNDASMFAITNHSFVMSHADPQIKKLAKYEVHSVAKAISYIDYLNRKISQGE